MANQKSPKLLKREKVITFSGEEDLIVPKRKGLGQPDNEDFVQVVGAVKPLADQPIMTNPDVQGLDATTSTITIKPIPTEPTPSTPVSTDQPVLPPKAPTPTTTTTTSSTGVTQITTTPISSTTTGTGIKYNQATVDPDLITTPPPFPNWSSLDCTTLDSEIKKLETFMATQKFTSAVADACNNQLATAKSLYNDKCVAKPQPQPQPQPVTPVIPVVGGIIGGGFGGGGGFGARPSGEEDAAVVEEEIKGKNYSWLWILLIIGGIYVLTRKKKNQ